MSSWTPRTEPRCGSTWCRERLETSRHQLICSRTWKVSPCSPTRWRGRTEQRLTQDCIRRRIRPSDTVLRLWDSWIPLPCLLHRRPHRLSWIQGTSSGVPGTAGKLQGDSFSNKNRPLQTNSTNWDNQIPPQKKMYNNSIVKHAKWLDKTCNPRMCIDTTQSVC